MYIQKRYILAKTAIALFVVYICLFLITNSSSRYSREIKSNYNLAGLSYEKLNLDQSRKETEHLKLLQDINDSNRLIKEYQNQLLINKLEQVTAITVDNEKAISSQKDMETETFEKIMAFDIKLQAVHDKVKLLTNCVDKQPIVRTQQRGDYWVLYNYVQADKLFKCQESITYTTHGDYSFLDNLVPLVERWGGPVSIALHAPGSDFQNTLESIAYLRECVDNLVRHLVTFHIYFSTKHVPKEVPKHNGVFVEPYNCSTLPPFLNVTIDQMYKSQKNLLYPVNVGRNIARDAAQTYYILPSDIELYPSLNIIRNFLSMIAQNDKLLQSQNPNVFPLHIFEVYSDQKVPDNKTVLLKMLHEGTAFPFHKKVCPECHTVPKAKEWQMQNETKSMHVFYTGKRNGKFVHWEPIFIGTHSDPLYDERLSWEGKSDKMTQGYALCVMDYSFMILDNAFLVHKPGIKVYHRNARRDMLAAKTRKLIKKIIWPELKVLYGVKKGCAV